MERWSDIKKEIRSISDSEKMQIELVADLVDEIIDTRQNLGLTQRDLAEKTGLKQSAIARMESGGAIPRLDTVLRVALAMGLKFKLIKDEQSASITY
ncbi:helix-turn-helix domain-containing protein [Bacillus thuringiensis]|uniref:helix-turn-helix domain-containing protein n=1 Tax=Bacillus thuringiensis TaxID=1428 RepID=UPI001298AB76|nr:helix-turn-helix transcriptional regulator [Bacillus thuringiensis]MEB8931947.1 helix-turn-helix transcriptional regulator [Bacillus cereus]MCR6790312.1 helix-turn-helix transcriptional regulator [Bacillus thuringiensis]MCR6826267.1 helix-turn-helix transcriptional regulator [Bacillus thuringiensis]MCR6832165.1 helix-turn-helix transcriptional regulator [Bacillus thuringiensis]MEB9325904.1 helix-turn-helix transcriptional regulator [Bacillus cereus]